MKVAVVAEYYPRAADPVLGVWAHRQALAARAAGAEVRVLVLHRPLPPLASLRRGGGAGRALATALRQPRHAALDGIEVRYVPFLSPPRPRSYGSWGAWAAAPLAIALARLRRRFDYDLVHAHYAVPAGDAVRRGRERRPLVVSVHGGDVLATARDSEAGRRNVQHTFAAARLVLANSTGIARRCRELGAAAIDVVHLGTDLPAETQAPPAQPTVVTTGHLVARKRHADVVRALAHLGERLPELRYVIVGDGPERAAIAALAQRLGVAARVELRGALAPKAALAATRAATVFAMSSVDEAFGVAYIEAMAGGVPAIGARGEDGPEEVAAAGGGMRLVAAGDVEALAEEIAAIAGDPARRRDLGEQARANVAAGFTWEHCGAATVAAYERALA